MSTQTALIVSETGGRIEATLDWPIPQPGSKQVQIRVTVAGLNPHDELARDIGLFLNNNYPAILGNDITSVVTLVGPDVTKLKVRDRVVSQLNIDSLGKIVVVSGSKEELQKYGATHVLDRHSSDEAVLRRIRDVVGDDLIYAFDTSNLPTEQHLAISTLSSSKKGTLARLRFASGAINESKIVREKKAGYEARDVFGMSHIKPETAKPFWGRVESYLKDGTLVPLKHEVVDGLDAEKVNQLLDRYRDGKKVVQTQFRVSA